MTPPQGRRIRSALPILAIVTLCATGAQAQDESLHASRLGDLYLSLAPDARVDFIRDVPTDAVFSIYLVIDVDFADIEQDLQNATNGISAWEVRAALPPQLFVVDVAYHPEISVDSGVAQVNVYDHVVETGTLVAAGGPTLLVEYSVLTPNGFTAVAELEPVENPTVAGEASWVEYYLRNGCTRNGVREVCRFRFANLGNLHLGASRPGSVASMGAMKARF